MFNRISSLRRRVTRVAFGPDGACAQLAGLQLRDGHSLCLESKPGDASVRKSLADAFLE